MKKILAILLLLGTPAWATDPQEFSVKDQCERSDYVVVGRAILQPFRPKAMDLDDFGRPVDEDLRWFSRTLVVERSLTGLTRESFRILWYPCCPEEFEAMERKSLDRAELYGIWVVFPDVEAVNAVWHPISRLEEFRKTLLLLNKYHEP